MPTTDPSLDPWALADTDPEFADYFGHFAFGEVVADAARLDGRVTENVRVLVQAAACLVAGGQTGFRTLVAAGLSGGVVTPVEVKEVVYQAVAYAGAARAIDYLRALNEILTDHRVPLPLPGQSASTPHTRLEHGKEVQARIVGGIDAVQARIDDAGADEKHLQRYLAANCFGDTVGRHGLEMNLRELVTFAMLVALGGADAQVQGHVAANLAVGNGRATLLAVLTLLVPFIGYPRALNGLAALNNITTSPSGA